MMKQRILFVCLGNICRSSSAEEIMRTLVRRAGREKEFEIDSAGISGFHEGELPDERMRACFPVQWIASAIHPVPLPR